MLFFYLFKQKNINHSLKNKNMATSRDTKCRSFFCYLFLYLRLLWGIYTLCYNLCLVIPFITKFWSLLLPTCILFFYISEKGFIYYCKLYSKIWFIFPFFLFFYRLILYLCKNVVFGCIPLMLLFLLYLYCFFIDSPIIHYKTIIVPYLLSFRILLKKSCNYSYFFIPYPEFLPIRLQLEQKDNKVGWKLLTIFSLWCNLLFFELDIALLNNIEITNRIDWKNRKNFINYSNPHFYSIKTKKYEQ